MDDSTTSMLRATTQRICLDCRTLNPAYLMYCRRCRRRIRPYRVKTGELVDPTDSEPLRHPQAVPVAHASARRVARALAPQPISRASSDPYR